MRFAGRLALVTGAASGIGLATARLLVAEGARVVLVDTDAAGLDRLDLPGARVVGSVADEATWARAAPLLDGLSLAVLSAGVAGAGRIAELDVAEWRRVLAINLDGAFLTLKTAMRAMAGGGAIVAVGSAAGAKAAIGTAAYAASKAALAQLVRVAALEGAPHLRVNALAPAGVTTPMWDQPLAGRIAAVGREAAFAELGAGVPLGRVATADETAAQIAFLLSDAAATITGATLLADGGYTL